MKDFGRTSYTRFQKIVGNITKGIELLNELLTRHHFYYLPEYLATLFSFEKGVELALPLSL